MKAEKVVTQYRCDNCRREIDQQQANPYILWTIGWFGNDCVHEGQVFVGDYQSYGHDARESHLCYWCKRDYLRKALEIVDDKIACCVAQDEQKKQKECE